MFDGNIVVGNSILDLAYATFRFAGIVVARLKILM
jgi:hypothetical protein